MVTLPVKVANNTNAVVMIIGHSGLTLALFPHFIRLHALPSCNRIKRGPGNEARLTQSQALKIA